MEYSLNTKQRLLIYRKKARNSKSRENGDRVKYCRLEERDRR